MPTKSVDELVKVARGALMHRELVELALKHSPNKAKELAQPRWPLRQAKATYALAKLRRDHEETFIQLTSTEHVHSDGEEHVRGDTNDRNDDGSER